MRLNHWALSGDWTAGEEAATADTPGGQIACCFHARDLNMVPSLATTTEPTRTARAGRRHRTEALSARPPAPAVTERTFQITFTDPGVPRLPVRLRLDRDHGKANPIAGPASAPR